jgi:hypothetical protein
MTANGRRLIPLCMLVAVCVAPLPANAATQAHKLTGTFDAEGVPGTGTMSIEVVVRNGTPVRIRNLSFKNLPARCNVSETPGSPSYQPAGKLSGGGGKNSNGDGIEYGRALQWIAYPGKRQVLMNGKLSKSGTSIKKGELQVHNNAPGSCQSAVGTFTAKK